MFDLTPSLRSLVLVLATSLTVLAGCKIPAGSSSEVATQLNTIERQAQVWKDAGARVFISADVPLGLSIWERTEFGIGNSGRVHVFATWEPETNGNNGGAP